jgi:hypothetical protein
MDQHHYVLVKWLGKWSTGTGRNAMSVFEFRVRGSGGLSLFSSSESCVIEMQPLSFRCELGGHEFEESLWIVPVGFLLTRYLSQLPSQVLPHVYKIIGMIFGELLFYPYRVPILDSLISSSAEKIANGTASGPSSIKY